MLDNRFNVAGQVVIITGAGQGIGREYAHAFAAGGAIPIVAELNGQNADKVVGEIEAEGGRGAGNRDRRWLGRLGKGDGRADTECTRAGRRIDQQCGPELLPAN